ncbi:MAG: PqqD family protein, partial [Acidobacteriota bacterium]
DAVGTRLWELLAEDDRLDAALQILTVEFEVDPKRLRGDIEGFVDSLATSGLAVVEGRPGDDGGAETGA